MVRCFGLQFNFDYRVTMLNILWALGCADDRAVLALVYLPVFVVTTFGVLLIAVTTCSTPSPMLTRCGLFCTLPISSWRLMHVLSSPIRSSLVGVTAAGYGLGQIFTGYPIARALLLRLGLGLTAAFFVLRGINIYGDPLRWTTQKSVAFTVLSFLKTNKYPPSLLFF